MGSRTVGWFSCGAASAVTMKLGNPDVIAYCDTGAEHEDNARFMADCEKWFGKPITILKSEKYADTWDVWEKRKYLAGVSGAPCTLELKIKPREAFQQAGDIHLFGFTADRSDMMRAESLRQNWPALDARFPLIAQGINKKACLHLLERAGIKPPATYALGMPNANCIPCVKATSPAYWALIRKEFPAEFERMAVMSRKMGVKLARLMNNRIFIDEIPENYPTTEPIAPECDILCALAEQDLRPMAGIDYK